jgi:penicillin-binding protein 1C
MAALVVDNQHAGSARLRRLGRFHRRARFAHVDMVQAARSPGSALKPFLYGLALDEGLIHSESLLADVPQSFSGYQPGNFQANFSGPVSASEALQKSLNVPAVEVLERLGRSASFPCCAAAA